VNGVGNPVSIALVIAQFVLLALLASPLEGWLPTSPRQAIGGAFLLGGIALALVAAVSMRATRFSVLPEPQSGGTLVEHGPYRFVRHPMYAAVLVCGVGACIAHADARHALWLVLIALVLWLKIRREERLLLDVYPGYADYRRRVRALVPGLF